MTDAKVRKWGGKAPLSSSSSAEKSSTTSSGLVDPLSSALEGNDPLSQMAAQIVDPLSQMASQMSLSQSDDSLSHVSVHWAAQCWTQLLSSQIIVMCWRFMHLCQSFEF